MFEERRTAPRIEWLEACCLRCLETPPKRKHKLRLQLSYIVIWQRGLFQAWFLWCVRLFFFPFQLQLHTLWLRCQFKEEEGRVEVVQLLRSHHCKRSLPFSFRWLFQTSKTSIAILVEYGMLRILPPGPQLSYFASSILATRVRPWIG